MTKYACVLAAGFGSRLKKLTQDKSKWMIKVNGVSLMERYLIAFKENNINNIIIITGHASKVLKESVLKLNKKFDLNIFFIHNEIFHETNNIFSLNIALKEITKKYKFSRLILAECDIFFAENKLKDFLSLEKGNHILCSKYQYWMDGSCITLDSQGNIESLLDKKEVNKSYKKDLYKTVNWYSFEKEYVLNQLTPFINAYSENISAVSYYELVIKILLQISNLKLSIFKIHPSNWVEIDDSFDLEMAECFDEADKGNLNYFVERYGGYWRFPWLKDLTLLVNPYFPSKNMLKEISDLNILISRNYPSSQEIIANLASKSFDVDKNEIIVANGVCEIITNLISKIDGSFEIVRPFFLEYGRSLGNRLIEKNTLEELTFDNHTILVNPNNPDGKIIDLEFIKSIAYKLEERGKYLIYDESFSDFYDESDLSLINNKYFRRTDNVILLKSLGKTYGIAGMRLGLLINSNKSNISQWRSYQPIWNINSYAEVFLDLLPRYKDEYKLSLKLINDNAEKFYSALVPFENENFKVYKPNANFILISFSSLKLLKEIEKELFKNFYLVKTIIERQGLPKYCIRIAIVEGEKNIEVASIIKRYFGRD